jgi:hypothetical protein
MELDMDETNFLLLLLVITIFISIVLSSYLWFIKKQRHGWLLRGSYFLRLACASFFGYGVYWIYEVTSNVASLSQIMALSSPFIFCFICLGTPWGGILNAYRRQPITLLRADGRMKAY